MDVNRNQMLIFTWIIEGCFPIWKKSSYRSTLCNSKGSKRVFGI